MHISPTAEGFRAAWRRPSLTLAEIAWRWTIGAAATTVFLFGLFEYLSTLTVSNAELLLLRSGQPYLVGQALAHIARGTLGRVMLSTMFAALMLSLFWSVAGALGRVATVRGLLGYFRRGVASANDRPARARLHSLVRLNVLRAAVSGAAILGFAGAFIIAGFVSTAEHPRPGLAFLLFLPLAGLVWIIWGGLNWLLTLAAIFAARDGENAMAALSAAATLCREHTGAVAAVSTWTGLAHLVAFVGATTIVGMPLGFVAIVPWRLVLAVMILITLAYFALADWIFMARLAGYVCIAEMPEALLVSPALSSESPSAICSSPLLQTTIDHNEPILSDV
jgi:hypothetical protein